MHIINDLSVGGAEMMLYKLLAETDRARFSPVVISLMRRAPLRERIEALGIPVYSAMMRPGWPTPVGLWRLVQLIQKLKPDLIAGWMYHSCFAAHVARLFSTSRAPILWSIHYSIISLKGEKTLTAAAIRACALLSRRAAQIVFVSRKSESQHGALGYNLEKSCVIPNGIDERVFLPSIEARRSVRSELGLPEDAFLIGVMGRYHPAKDHSNFLHAAALLSKVHPQTHFLLIGPKVDGQNRELCHLVEQLGLASRTHLLGERHDTPRLSAALDVFSLSSSFGESFPNVVGEAMACEVPCAVTDVGGTAWLVGKTGLVVPPRNPRALAEAWQELINLGRDGRAALGRQARARVVERFALKAVAGRYMSLYEEVLARENPKEFTTPVPPALAALSTTLEETGAQ